YEKIPNNDRKLFELKIEKVAYGLVGQDYILDLGLFRNEVDLKGHNDLYYRASLGDQGDLSTFYGYETFDATGYRIVAPKMVEVERIGDPYGLLKDGVAYAKAPLNDKENYVELPIHLVGPDF